MEATADGDVLNLAEPAVDMHEHVIEDLLVRALVPAEVAVHLRGGQQRPNLLADGRQLGRIHGGDVLVLVEKLFQTGDVTVGFGAGHWRNEVVDKRGVSTALGLCAFARVVDQEGVDHWQLADGSIRAAGSGKADGLARQPLQVAVLAHVNHGIGAETALRLRQRQEAVAGQVMVRRRQIRVVVDTHRVVTETARWLHHDHDIAEGQARNVDVLGIRVDVQGARRGTPLVLHVGAKFFRQGSEELLVGGSGQAKLGCLHNLFGQPVRVLAAGLDDGVHERIWFIGTILGGGISGDFGGVAEVVSGVGKRVQHLQRGCWCVQTDSVADAGVLGRVRREHDGDALVSVVDVAERGVTGGDAGQAVATLEIRDVGNELVGVDFLKRERDRDDAAVEFGDGDLCCDVQRRQTFVVVLPCRLGRSQGQTLDDGNVQVCECGDIPAVIVLAGLRECRAVAASGEHRGDERVAGS